MPSDTYEDRSRARVARRLSLARHDLQRGTGDDTHPAIEMIGSAVADWVLAQSRSMGVLEGSERPPPTTRQLEVLRNLGFIDAEVHLLLDTAYRARNVAHHEQIGLKREEVWSLWRGISRTFGSVNHEPAGGRSDDPTLEEVRETVLRLEQQARASKKHRHQWVVLHLDPRAPFDEKYGPEQYDATSRQNLTKALAKRGMLTGVIRNHSWPLVTCDACGAVIPVDNGWTPQENCASEPDERIEVFCAFGCVEWYQRTLRELEEERKKQGPFELDPGEYFVQNLVEIVSF